MEVGQLPPAIEAPPAVPGLRRDGSKRHPWRFADGLSFKANLLIGIAALVLLSGAALILIAYRSSRATTAALAGALFREASAHAVTQSRDFMDRAVPLVDSLARLGSDGLHLNDS